MSSVPILSTKLYIPPPRPKVVPRSRLIEKLNEGLYGKLTLISAPAGFGKTTLVSEWLATTGRDVAWLSLDDGDGDPSRFLTYFVMALQRVSGEIGEDILESLHSLHPLVTEPILTALLNEIADLRDPFILVLDDYHAVDSRSVDDALAFLIEYLPPQMHVVITTREDPNLPLARLRARGQLTEIRAADLRFSHDEATGFLTQAMGLDLEAGDIGALERRTEGWVAGLQLAALSMRDMRDRKDISEFIHAFAGDNRYIVDYLVDEVLEHQPENVRNFLLETSVLDRLCGPLCDAVTVQAGSSGLLEALERGNLFVVPLDDKRQWYRYHHLFADVLKTHLFEQQPTLVATLHLRASEWFEANDLTADAVRYAFLAEDMERVANLVELAWSAMDKSRQSATWLRWARQIPDEMVVKRPVLSVGYAWALLEAGELEAGESRLRDAEWCLENAKAEIIVVDESEFQSLPAAIASARAYIAQAHNDTPNTIKYAQQALDLLPEDDHLRRGVPASMLGLASWVIGDLDAAFRAFADAMDSFRKAGNILFAITGTYILADIRLAQGRLREAISVYENSLKLATEHANPVLKGTADLYLRLSELLRERGDSKTAAEYMARSEELSEKWGLPRWRYFWCLAQARMKVAQDDFAAALKLLDEAEDLYIRGPVPDMRPVAALKARIWIRQGNLDQTLRWAREEGLSADDDLNYVREFEHITLARVLIGQYQQGDAQAIDVALGLIERLRESAEAGGRQGSLIEIHIVAALAYEAIGDVPAALESLERALILAEPEGYVQIFVDEGGVMKRLLAEALRHGKMATYAGRLLAAFEDKMASSAIHSNSVPALSSQTLIDPLSERELEVLQLVAEGLSNREIAERLFLALDTVKGHNRRIYGKLQVQRRTEAVARARELGLIQDF